MTHNRWWNSLFQEAQALLTVFNPPQPPQPGLYTYPVALPGGQRRIHLRVEQDGRGLLFIDVTDVIHLNTTATEMTKLALDNVPQQQAETHLLRRYDNVSREEIAAALEQIYEMVQRLQSNTEGCPTCAIANDLIFKPIFSTPVNAPYKADLALTYACNNACPHCYNEPERFEMQPLPKEQWFQVLDKLVTIGVPHIILTGGEPTLYPDLAALINYGDQQGLILGMNSNGRALSHRPLMQEIADAGLNHLQVTLESNRAEVHNVMVGAQAFDQTVQGIKNALACGVHTITNTTITRQNSDQLLETVEFLHDLGLSTFAMNGMIYAGGGVNDSDAIPAEEMAVLLAGVRDKAQALNMRFLWYTVTDYCRFSPVALGLDPKRCNAAEYSICIEPNGAVLPCQSYYVSAGNILTDPWEQIWNSELFLSFRNREDDPLAAGLPEKCWDCPDLPMCGGGCRLEHEAQAGVRAAERGCARARVTLRSSGRTQ
ncbi:MAG: radical SAM protein [Anaerolineae bacterium]|nr:radical SAM protein [Anaerolineae bacterium]